jgi:hypothetical protein
MKKLNIADIKASEILSKEERKMVVGGSFDMGGIYFPCKISGTSNDGYLCHTYDSDCSQQRSGCTCICFN